MVDFFEAEKTVDNMSQPIRVLHFLPDLSRGGGMANVVLSYHRKLDARRVVFDYLCLNNSSDSNFEDEVLSLGGSFYYLSDYGKTVRKASKSFFQINGRRYDILHCHPIFGAELLGGMAKKAGIKHIIAHSHSTRFSDKTTSAIRNRFISYFVGAFATDYIACGNDSRVLLHSHGKDAYIMHNAIDCTRFAFNEEKRKAMRGELGLSADDFVIGHVGRLSSEKNQSFLLDIAKAIKDEGASHCKMLLAGEGPLRGSLERRLMELGLSNTVRLLGARKDIDSFYSAIDAFALPSLFEGMPVSAIEAQAAGLPCFLSDAITQECAFGNVSYLPIGDAKPWVIALKNGVGLGCADRHNGAIAARNAGFDIKVEVERLMNHYQAIASR